MQETLLAAAQQWPSEGIPDNPRAWLTSVAHRRFIDQVRADSSRRRREEEQLALEPTDSPVTESVDDTLTLLFLCAHPDLSVPSQLALTLRAVGGLTTEEIASAFLVPASTMGQRITRAKATLKGRRFELPPGPALQSRLQVVLQVLYLIFNEGYVASSGPSLQRVELADEAIRLTRVLRRLLPGDCEVAGLLALLLLTHARSAARVGADGQVVPLAEQDRSRWDAAAIEEGVALLEATLGTGPVGPYQMQAAIAAVHDEASSDATTDWAQILALYGVLEQLMPSPVLTLNRAVAVARVQGPAAGLELLETLADEESMRRSHRLQAVRAHLLEQSGQLEEARQAYAAAASLTTNASEQRYLLLKAAIRSP